MTDGEGGGCGEADYGDGGEGGAEVGEVGVCGAEVVAPFGDAVGFVDGDTGELALRVDSVEVLAEAFGECILRGYIEKSGPWMA